MRARAFRLSVAVGIVVVTASLVACGDVLPVDEERSGAADASGDGDIALFPDAANGDEIHAEGEAGAAVSQERVVFVTSGTFSGKLGGIVGADEKCQAAADASLLLQGKMFQAWLSTSKDPVSGRLTHGDKPYRRVDKKAIANDWSDLTDGTLLMPLNLDERGNEIESGPGYDPSIYVWTGTTAAGAGLTQDCEGWTSESGASTVGVVSATSGSWTNDEKVMNCLASVRLYCFEK